MVTHGVTIASTSKISVVASFFIMTSEFHRPSPLRAHKTNDINLLIQYYMGTQYLCVTLCISIYRHIDKNCILKLSKCTKYWKIVVHNKITNLCMCANVCERSFHSARIL